MSLISDNLAVKEGMVASHVAEVKVEEDDEWEGEELRAFGLVEGGASSLYGSSKHSAVFTAESPAAFSHFAAKQ